MFNLMFNLKKKTFSHFLELPKLLLFHVHIQGKGADPNSE